jgi:hypothetical protein
MAQTFPLYYLGGIEGKIVTVRGRPVLLPDVGEHLNLTDQEINYLIHRYSFPESDFVPFTRDKNVLKRYMSRKERGVAVASNGQELTKEELLALLSQIDEADTKKAEAEKEAAKGSAKAEPAKDEKASGKEPVKESAKEPAKSKQEPVKEPAKNEKDGK